MSVIDLREDMPMLCLGRLECAHGAALCAALASVCDGRAGAERREGRPPSAAVRLLAALSFVAVSRRKATFAFNTSNTNNATANTTDNAYFFEAGEVIRASTGGAEATGAAASGNTWLRLNQNVSGKYTEVASNDHASTPCSCGQGSLITYTVPASGFYQVSAACYANTSCSGTVAVYAE